MILILDQMHNLSIDEIVNLYRVGYRLEESPRIISLIDPTVDPIVNFGKVTVSTGYTSTDTSIILVSGNGSKLPNPSVSGDFNLVWWNYTDYPDPSDDPNKEIVRCTSNSADTLSITRAQEGTSASSKNTSGKTYKMVLTLTAKTISDLQTDATNKVNTHASVTSLVHNFDSSGNAPAQTHDSSRHTGTIGTWNQIDKTTSNISDIITKSHTSLTDIGTNSHSQIDTHISSYTNIHGISTGLDASKPTSPTVGQRYIAVDTNKDYECYISGIWRDTTATHAALTVSVHNFDGSGNAPPQVHGLASHTGTIGDHQGNLTGVGTNTHAQIDSHIAATSAHGTSGTIVGTTDTQSLTNKTITDSTNNVMAKSLKSTTTTIDISGATAPTSGQVLTATSSTAATWQTSSAVPSPATSVVSETSFGQSTAVGTSTNYARQDHTHGTPSSSGFLTTGNAASSVVSETSFGQSSTVGTSTNYARQDHTHGTPSGVYSGVGTSGQYASTKYSASSVSINWANGNVQSMTLANGGNSFSFSNGISGGRYMLILASGGSSTTATWTGVKWPNATPPTLSTTGGRIDIVTFVYDGTNYYGNISFNYY